MNTSSISKFSAAGLGLLFSVLLTTTAVAGPGPEYWARMNKNQKPASYPTIWRTKADADTKARSEAAKSTALSAAVQLCTDAHVVSMTAMQPMMANGKGPLIEKKIGTKTVCHICPVTTTVAKNSLPNGKGQVTTTTLTQTGVEHNCAKCTGNPMKS